MEPLIQHIKKNNRFELSAGTGSAYVQYRFIDQVMVFIATIVTETANRDEIISELVQHALQYAQANKRKIIASCPMFRKYMDNYPEYKSLLLE